MKKAELVEQCVDNPQFANCHIIVQANYCGKNPYYSKFCCASCTEAGQDLYSEPKETEKEPEKDPEKESEKENDVETEEGSGEEVESVENNLEEKETVEDGLEENSGIDL